MKKHYFLTLLFLIPVFSFGQDILYQELFETDGNGSRYNVSAEYTDNGGDFFTRTDGSNITAAIQLTGQDGDFWFGGMDLDGDGESATQTLSFTVDITDYQNLNFSILLAEDDATDGNEDWDGTGDSVIITYAIDGGAAQNLLAVEAESPDGIFNSQPRIDTDFDGVGDGAIITADFTEFSAAIPETGTSIEITITVSLNAGEEDIAFDRITLEGDAVLSTVQTEIEGFSLYPNPVTNGRLNIATAKNGTKHITVFNVLGKQVINKIFTGNILDVSSLNSGIYMLKVTEDSKTVIRKLVVR